MHILQMSEYIEGEVVGSVPITPDLVRKGGIFLGQLQLAMNVSDLILFIADRIIILINNCL